MRSEGEQVYSGDKVQLSDIEEEESFVGCAGREKIVVTQHLPEGWKIELYSKTSKELQEMLKGGDMIRLFHKELEGFLTLRPNDLFLRIGKNALDRLLQFHLDDRKQSEKNMLGVRLKTSEKEKNETNALLSIWQVINQDPKDGEAIEWAEPFRLKHVVTALYLEIRYSQAYLDKNKLEYDHGELRYVGDEQLDEEGEAPYLKRMKLLNKGDKDDYVLSFTHDLRSPLTLFEAVPIAGQNQSDYVMLNGLLRIRHKHTESMLRAQDNTFKLPKQEDAPTWFDTNSGSGGSDSASESVGGSLNSGITGNVHSLLGRELSEADRIKPVFCSRAAADEHVFLVSYCKNIRYDYLHFARCMADELFSFLADIKTSTDPYFESKAAKLKLKQATEVIKQLDSFVKGKIAYSKYDEKSTQIDIQWRNKDLPQENKKKKKLKDLKPIKRRQKALREMLVLEALLGVIDFFWHSVLPKNITKENFTKSTKQPWLLCKAAHYLISSIVQQNKANIAVIIELGAIDMMFEQISTGWHPCISEIFSATSGNRGEVTVIDKSIIRSFVDQIEETLRVDYPYKIIDFLASLCAPAGRGDYTIQKWVIDLLVGSEISSHNVPSSLIFHTKTVVDELNNVRVKVMVDRSGLLRPPYKPSGRNREDKIDYRMDNYDEEDAKEMDRSWIDIEEFLPNALGDYNDIGASSLRFSKMISTEENPDLQLREHQVSYYRSLLNLYRAACTSQHYHNQKIVSALISVDHILTVVSNPTLSSFDKQLYLDLFNELYANSAVLGPLKKSVLPSILIWNGEKSLLKWEDQQHSTESKIFALKSQPYLERLVSDWVSSWESDTAANSLNQNAYSSLDADSQNENLSVNEVILEQRLKLHDYLLAEFLEILDTLTIEKNSLAAHLFGQAEEMETRWKHRVGYYISFCKVLNTLLLRDFFDEDYNQDIEAIEEFSQRKVRYGDLDTYRKLFGVEALFAAGIRNENNYKLIAMHDDASKDLLRVFENLAINALNQTAPVLHYSLLQPRSVEMFSKIFHTLDEGSLPQLLCEFKTGVIKLLQIIHDFHQTRHIYELWDGNFKALYNKHFSNIDLNGLSIERKVTRVYPTTSRVGLAKFGPFEENNEYQRMLFSRSSADFQNINQMIDTFESKCSSDKDLRSYMLAADHNSQEYTVLSNILLDILLYQRPTLAVEATNMLYKLFSMQKEMERTFEDSILLLDDNYYKVYQLLHHHQRNLIKLTRNFTRIPNKPKEIMEFFAIFRTGNPLLNKEARKFPGLIDLCYSGIDLSNTQYTVFRRNKLFYQTQDFSNQRKATLHRNIVRRNAANNRSAAKQLQMQRKRIEEERKRAERVDTMQDAVRFIKQLSVKLMVGKIDLWPKNQELMRTVGLHKKIFKLLERVIGKKSKNRFSSDPDEQYCQVAMVNILYEFLYFFVWENDDNTVDLTREDILEVLFSQMDLSDSVPKLLTEIIVDNDIANELISDEVIKKVVMKLDRSTWGIEAIEEEKDEEEKQGGFNFLGMVKDVVKTSAPKEKGQAYPVRFIDLLKTFIESDIGPKPGRQKQVIEVIMSLQQDNPAAMDEFLFKDKKNEYDLQRVLAAYFQYEYDVQSDSKNLTKVLDPRQLENEFNFHLEFVDLLGLCCRGNNVVTTNFCKSLYESEKTIIEPLITPDVPLCIKAPFTRFLHGVYFSDPKAQTFHEEGEQTIWNVFKYNDFKKIFANLAETIHSLLNLFAKDVERKKREEKLEDDLDQEKMRKIEEEKAKLRNFKKKMVFRRAATSNQRDLEMDSEAAISDPLKSFDNFIEIEELKIFQELEQYGDYVFDIILPFLIDFIDSDFECCAPNKEEEEREISNFHPLSWESLTDLLPQNFGEKYSMAYILRVIVYLVVKLTEFNTVLYTENRRDTIREFLKAIMVYMNEHYEDENSLLEFNDTSSREMQVRIIKTINILEDARDRTSFESGDLDVDLIKERKEQSFIQERALPQFLKAVSSIRFEGYGPYLKVHETIKKDFDCDEINPEFVHYVSILMKHLQLHIANEDGQDAVEEIRKMRKNKKKGKIASAVDSIAISMPRQQRQQINLAESSNIEEGKESEEEEEDHFNIFYLFKNNNKVSDTKDGPPQVPSNLQASSSQADRSSRVQRKAVELEPLDPSDFEKWVAYGGSYILKLIELLNNISVIGNSEADCFHLRALQALLVQYEFKMIVPYTNVKISELKRRQIALEKLGVINMTMSIVSRAKVPSRLSPYLKKILPDVIKIGSNLLALGITDIQDRFIFLYYEACRKLNPNQFFLVALKEILREIRQNLKYLNTHKGDPFLSKITPNLLSFIKNLCEGHHRHTQEFLSYQPNSLSNIDLISELASLLISACKKLKKRILFINNEHFSQHMAPRLMINHDSERRMIAWHKQNCKIPDIGDLKLTTQIMRTLTECIQGPCIKNQYQLVTSRVCKFFNELIEFIGAFFYRKMRKRSLLWSGHGMNMYSYYLKTKPPEDDMEFIEISQFRQLMMVIAATPDKDTRNNILLINHTGDEYMNYIEAMDSLEQNILVFYNSMLEGNHHTPAVLTNGEKLKEDQVRRIPAYVFDSVDSNLLLQNLHNYWKSARLEKEATMISELQGSEIGQWNSKQRKKVFLYYSFVTLLGEKYEQAHKLKDLMSRWERAYQAHMNQVVGRIEVQNSSQEVEVVYFPKPPIVRLYWNRATVHELKEDMLYKIKRDTPEEKLMDFQDISTDIIILMGHLRTVSFMPKKLPIFGRCYKMIANYSNFFLFLLGILTLAINSLLIYSLETEGNSLEFEDSEVKDYISYLGYAHFGISILSLLSYTFMKGSLTVKTKLARQRTPYTMFPAAVLKVANCVFYFLSCCRCFSCFRRRPASWQKRLANTIRLGNKIRLPRIVWGTYYYLKNTSTIYHLSFAAMSGLGLFLDPAFFAFHLIVLLKGIRMTRYVLSSVTKNFDQVMATFLIALVVLFWFMMLSYNIETFRGSYFFEGLMESDSLYNFLKTHIAYGFTVNPYWGENEELPVTGMFYIMIYFIIINLIMTAIVTGIIIDSFSEMRSISQNIKEDTEDRCFICNIDRDDFEKEEIEFSKHIKRDHNMWNYLFFRVYLDTLDPTDMTGLETYVYQCLKQNSIAFYPIKKSIEIEGRNKQKKDWDSLFNKLEKLEYDISTTREELEDERERNTEESKKVSIALERVVSKIDALAAKVNNLRR